jgi:hypothetical protein
LSLSPFKKGIERLRNPKTILLLEIKINFLETLVHPRFCLAAATFRNKPPGPEGMRKNWGWAGPETGLTERDNTGIIFQEDENGRDRLSRKTGSS